MAKGRSTVLATGGIAPVPLPWKPDYIEFVNYTAQETPTATWVVKGFWDENMGQGFGTYDFFDAGPVYSTNSTSTNGVSTFEAGQMLQYGPLKQVVSATKANPVNFEVTGHGFSSGDVVVFQGLYSTQYTAGMPQMDGIPFTVTVVDANNFTVPWNTNQSNYTALAASPTGAKVKKVLYPYLYFPGVSFISAITTGTTTTIVTTHAHNLVVGQQVAFRIPTVSGNPTAWGTTELNSLPNNLTPGAPAYGYVIAVTDYKTVVVNINSSTYTAYNSNIPVANVSGMSFPQMIAVGDVNTGAMTISSGSVLYPPPQYTPIGTTGINTINGPAIKGAYVNNTSQGFVIGPAMAVAAQSGQTIYWRAYLHDINVV